MKRSAPAKPNCAGATPAAGIREAERAIAMLHAATGSHWLVHDKELDRSARSGAQTAKQQAGSPSGLAGE